VSCTIGAHESKLTDRTCAIIGGVLTIAGLVDSFIFNGAKRLKGEEDSGFGGPGGKMVS
jgi:hypothetical protein